MTYMQLTLSLGLGFWTTSSCLRYGNIEVLVLFLNLIVLVLKKQVLNVIFWQEKRGNREYTRLQKALDDCRDATDSALPSIAQQLQDSVDTANQTCMSTIF